MARPTDNVERLGIGALIGAAMFAGAAACGPIPIPLVHRVVLWCGAAVGTALLVATIGWLVRLSGKPEPAAEVLAACGVIAVLAAGFGAYPIRFWSTSLEKPFAAGPPVAGQGPAETLDERVVRLFKAGNYAEAETIGRQAVAESERKNGPDAPATATSLKNLAVVFRRQSRYGEAEPLQKRAVEIHERTLGADHADTADSLYGLALLYAEQGRYADAEPLYQRALAIREKALGPDHPDTVACREDLASMQAERNDRERDK